MSINLPLIGLGLIDLAWIIQVIFMFKGQKTIRPCFAGLQFIGITLLVVDTILGSGQMNPMAWLNAISAVFALMVMVLILRK